MSIRKRQRSLGFTGNHISLGNVYRLFLILLLLAGTSGFTQAQKRYTVNRPVRTYQSEAPKAAPQTEASPQPDEFLQPPNTIQWETDYENARQTAESTSRQLLIYLYADRDTVSAEKSEKTIDRNGDTIIRQSNGNQTSPPIASACKEFDTVVLDDSFVRTSLDRYVLLKLPLDAKVTTEDGTQKPILSLPDFEHMAGYPGLVVMDYEHRDDPYYGKVTGILPFWKAECPSAENAAIFLELPPGTLTQRTLTYAVRIHPDKPLSSEGEPLPIVVQVATDHALYQAERGVLGHQNFGTRSQKVIGELGSGMPSEICAQSWSDKSMFEGAIGCMRGWRGSSAHWSIARKNHRYYGYDMIQGKSGSWYAVGFFID